MVSFTRRSDGQTLLASHINELQIAIENIDQGLITPVPRFYARSDTEISHGLTGTSSTPREVISAVSMSSQKWGFFTGPLPSTGTWKVFMRMGCMVKVSAAGTLRIYPMRDGSYVGQVVETQITAANTWYWIEGYSDLGSISGGSNPTFGFGLRPADVSMNITSTGGLMYGEFYRTS